MKAFLLYVLYERLEGGRRIGLQYARKVKEGVNPKGIILANSAEEVAGFFGGSLDDTIPNHRDIFRGTKRISLPSKNSIPQKSLEFLEKMRIYPTIVRAIYLHELPLSQAARAFLINERPLFI